MEVVIRLGGRWWGPPFRVADSHPLFFRLVEGLTDAEGLNSRAWKVLSLWVGELVLDT